MKQKHTIEEFMCWRRENLVNLVRSLCKHLDTAVNTHDASNLALANLAKSMCEQLDARETPIAIVTESGGRDIDTSELT